MTVLFDLTHRDPVAPVPGGVERPRWSVMIPTYQSARTLGVTLESVLAQSFEQGEMQIEVVDDWSDDDVELVTRTIGKGRVGFHRQSQNVGHIRNFHTCLMRARGEIVHLLHGDDLVLPGFYETLDGPFREHRNLGAAFCRSIYIDDCGNEIGVQPAAFPECGIIPDAARFLACEQRILTPSIAVRRHVYEVLGGFDKRLPCAEDWEMWVRIAALFPIWQDTRVLAAYRMHQNSNTGRHIRTGTDAAANRSAIAIFSNYLSAPLAKQVASQARRTYSASAVATAVELLATGDFAGAAAQFSEAYRLAPAVALRRAFWAVLREIRKHANV